MRRFPLPPFLLFLILTRAAVGQSPNGTISGLILDPSGRPIVGAEILILNDGTGIRYPGTSNGEGIYAIPNLPPRGAYDRFFIPSPIVCPGKMLPELWVANERLDGFLAMAAGLTARYSAYAPPVSLAANTASPGAYAATSLSSAIT